MRANLEQYFVMADQKFKGKKTDSIIRTLTDREIRSKFHWRKLYGIHTKLFMTIFIPVIFMAVFGVVSYRQSADAIITNYEKSTTDTLVAISDYLKLGMDSVAGKSLEFMQLDSVRKYYDRGKAGLSTSSEEIALSQPLGVDLMVAQGSNKFIQAIHIFGKTGIGFSTQSAPPEGLYHTFQESEEGKKIALIKERNLWVGAHPFIDDATGMKRTDYALSIIRKMPYDNGYVIMDVSMSEIMTMLTKFDYGKGSVIAFVTGDGREIVTNSDQDKIFTELPYFQSSVKGQEQNGFSYEVFKEQEYLYLYNRVGDTGAMVCALIPRGTIIQQAERIKKLSVVFVSIASVLAIGVGIAIAGGIAGAISRLSKSIALAAKGDLTTKFDTKRKDEFHSLSANLSDMVQHMRRLISDVSEMGTKVTISAESLSSTSNHILADTKDISLTIDEIEKGIVQQAADTELCLNQMSNLSNKINQVYDCTYEIENIAGDTKTVAGKGVIIIEELSDKTKSTSQITEEVIREIEALELQTHTIESFVIVINNIASQTNLLSLNASIEAARAGSAGLGFAVVAEEIRKLADQSVDAVKQIQTIVSVIQNKTKSTVITAEQAKSIVRSQTEALNNTIQVFEDINQNVIHLVNNLNHISTGVKEIETAKLDTLEAVRSIAAVSQETAAASEEVSATANNQIGSVEHLSHSATELAQDAKKLKEGIKMFRISDIDK
jgi:methyl-accepting chemotaxis protein